MPASEAAHARAQSADDDADGTDGANGADNADAERTSVAPGTVPAWFTAGAYAWATDGSKKRPLHLDERDLRERFIRGSGPGGQAINKLSTNVELVHVPTHTRITCQHTRSREQNREIARRLMSQRLEWLIKQSWRGAAHRSVLASKWDKARQRKHTKRKKQRRRAASLEPSAC